MEKVVKKTLGYGKPKENENFTHVIFTEAEYNKNLKKIFDSEEAVRQAEKNYNAAITRYKKSADDKIAEIRAQADGRVAEAHAETNKQKKEAEKFKNLNKNLIRVATEKANSKRGLSPKKEHNGYVFLNVEEFTFNCECEHSTKSSRTVIVKLPCFKIRLQSPYDISFELNAVKDLIDDDFLKKIMSKIGVSSVYTEGIVGYTENEVRKIWNDEEPFIFKIICKANFQKGFWEVEFFSRDMVVVPPEMTIIK